MNRLTPVALILGLAVAGCAGMPVKEKPKDVLTEEGAVLMQAAIDPDTKHAVARMLCGKQGLNAGTRDFARCVIRLHGRDRALSRARGAESGAMADPRGELCMEPGEFTLTRCYEI